MTRLRPPCTRCGYLHTGADARAIGRLDPDQPTTYRADYPGAPTRTTRQDAVQDMCERRAGTHDREDQDR